MHSTRPSLSSEVASQGTWAGDRITICISDQLEDFNDYKDVSNVKDVEIALQEP